MSTRSEAMILGMALKTMDEKMAGATEMPIESRAFFYEAMLLTLMDIVRDSVNHMEKINE